MDQYSSSLFLVKGGGGAGVDRENGIASCVRDEIIILS